MSIPEELLFYKLVVQDAENRKGSEQEKAPAASVSCEDALRKTVTEKQKRAIRALRRTQEQTALGV